MVSGASSRLRCISLIIIIFVPFAIALKEYFLILVMLTLVQQRSMLHLVFQLECVIMLLAPTLDTQILPLSCLRGFRRMVAFSHLGHTTYQHLLMGIRQLSILA